MAAAGVSKLGTSLSVVFVAFLVALFAQFILVLCRRRRRRRTVPPVSGDDERRSPLASKEVFLFFCLRTAAHPSRVDPSSTPSLDDSAGPTPESPEMNLVDLLKLSGGGLYGPSKILFTIKEEEKEEMESVCSNSAEKGPEWKYDGGRRSLEDCFQREEGTPEIKPAVVCSTADYCCVNIETTPFATPCASPSYFTPSESPGRGHPINMPPPPPASDV